MSIGSCRCISLVPTRCPKCTETHYKEVGLNYFVSIPPLRSLILFLIHPFAKSSKMSSIREVSSHDAELSPVEPDEDLHALPAYTQDEKKGADVEVTEGGVYVPDDSEEFIDPRLKDYPVPLVAKTVDLYNDPT